MPTHHVIGRPLTHDQLKAAEAAFQGLPFHPSWSQAARTVYDGILLVKWTVKPCSDRPRQ